MIDRPAVSPVARFSLVPYPEASQVGYNNDCRAASRGDVSDCTCGENMSIRHAMTALGVLLLSSAGPWGLWVGTVTARAGQGDANWPQFRGPRGDGTTTSEKLPLTWSES